MPIVGKNNTQNGRKHPAVIIYVTQNKFRSSVSTTYEFQSERDHIQAKLCLGDGLLTRLWWKIRINK